MSLPPTANKLRDTAGVSTFELMIVVAMMCVIAGFIFLKLIRGNQVNDRQQAAVTFANYLQKARLDSMRRQVTDINQMAQVRVFDRRSFSIAIDADGDNQLDIPLVMNQPPEQGIEINGPFPKAFIFNGQGRTVDSLNNSASPEPITLSNSAGSSAVKFSETGEVIVVPAVKLTAAK
jgi:hypothetical protein